MFSNTEALWYLRGEDNIKFLRRHKNPFWDAVAGDDAGLFVGLNYGLLVRFPREDGMEPINQLEEKVIARLVEGQCSRNMTCILHKPGQPTKQEACTSTCSFVCRRSDGTQGAESLDMVLHQRSSDVAVGLVWDVAVWALILHLVCREVGLRTHGRRQLEAGRLTFNLVSAHFYDKNAGEVDLVLQREIPIARRWTVVREPENPHKDATLYSGRPLTEQDWDMGPKIWRCALCEYQWYNVINLEHRLEGVICPHCIHPLSKFDRPPWYTAPVAQPAKSPPG